MTTRGCPPWRSLATAGTESMGASTTVSASRSCAKPPGPKGLAVERCWVLVSGLGVVFHVQCNVEVARVSGLEGFRIRFIGDVMSMSGGLLLRGVS